MIPAPLVILTYSVPTLEQRRENWAARVAYFAHVLNTHVIEPARRYMCYCCGAPGPGNWCNTCEVQGNCPIPGQPRMITPICNACSAMNLTCPICGVAPADGPSDLEVMNGNLITSPGALY